MEKQGETAGHRVGDAVRRFRQERGWTLAEVSAGTVDSSGLPALSVGQLSKLELGQRRVTAEDLDVLSRVLGVTADELLRSTADNKLRELDRLVRLLADAISELEMARVRVASVRIEIEGLSHQVEDDLSEEVEAVRQWMEGSGNRPDFSPQLPGTQMHITTAESVDRTVERLLALDTFEEDDE